MRKEFKTPKVYCVYATILVAIVLIILVMHSLVTEQDIFYPQIKTGCIIITVLSMVTEYYRRKEQKKEG